MLINKAKLTCVQFFDNIQTILYISRKISSLVPKVIESLHTCLSPPPPPPPHTHTKKTKQSSVYDYLLEIINIYNMKLLILLTLITTMLYKTCVSMGLHSIPLSMPVIILAFKLRMSYFLFEAKQEYTSLYDGEEKLCGSTQQQEPCGSEQY